MARTSKTVRLSDEIIEMIEAQAGENFTAKFEALVTRCVWELPKKEQELAGIQERIDRERKELARIQKKVRELDRSILNAEQAVRNYNYTLKGEIKKLGDALADM